MEKFTQHTGLVAPLDAANVDTDQIIPKQFLQKTTREGFGIHLFHDWRYLDGAGIENNPNFVLNQQQYQGASILLSRENFGCGSSREHAPWALQDFGFRVIIASSFADIFYANCINIGILPVRLLPEEIEQLFTFCSGKPQQITVDLQQQTLTIEAKSFSFSIDAFHKYCLSEGVDSIGWTLNKLDLIEKFEANLPAWQ